MGIVLDHGWRNKEVHAFCEALDNWENTHNSVNAHFFYNTLEEENNGSVAYEGIMILKWKIRSTKIDIRTSTF